MMEFTETTPIHRPVPTLGSTQPAYPYPHSPSSTYSPFGYTSYPYLYGDVYQGSSPLSHHQLQCRCTLCTSSTTPDRKPLPQSLPNSPCSPASDYGSSPTHTTGTTSPALNLKGTYSIIQSLIYNHVIRINVLCWNYLPFVLIIFLWVDIER